MSSSSVVVSGDEYLTLPRAPQTWLVEPLIPTSGAALFYGDPKVGKSYAALQLALALRHGGDWLGFPIRTAGPVVYIQLDTPRSLWGERLDQLKKGGYPIGALHMVDRETLDLYPFDITDQHHKNLLKSEIKPLQPTAVIIDTIRESHSLDENDSTAMRNVVGELVDATQPAAMILISHARKPSQDSGYDLLSDNRGSGYVVGRMDCIFRMTKKTLHYTGRGIEEGSIRITRGDDGFWSADSSEIELHVEKILLDPHYKTVREKAKELSRILGRSEEAARSLIRRYMAGHEIGGPNSRPTPPIGATD